MFTHSVVILLVIAVAFIIPKVMKLSTELSMFVAALAGAAAHSIMLSVTGSPHNPVALLPIRHIVEGAFTYFDVCLIFLTATFFMALLRESGGVAFIVRKIVSTFHSRRTICLLLLTFVLLLPGALTGSGATTVLTVGALVGSVLAAMGVDETKRAAIIFLGAAMSAAAPPINLWAMMAAAGANMPYVGFGKPLFVLSVAGALFSMFWLAGRGTKKIDLDQALANLPEAPEGQNWFRVLAPFILLLACVIAGRIWFFSLPVLGLPLLFMVASFAVVLLSPRKLQFWSIACSTVHGLLPLVGIMVVVGVLIQIMALSGARGLISLAVVTLPLGVLYLTLCIILPLSEGLVQYAVAPLLGVPLIMLFNMRGLDPIIALSAMAVIWPLGDCLPPTAVVGRATVMELGYKGRYFGDFVKACLVPMAFIAILGTLFLIFSTRLSFLGG
ncbi:MAG: C4-dicarboxylate ABC transporter [Aminobacterium sp.]|jgi:TRAP-type C4-dicarboxylate transport system permease large subunit|uniref:C4-dicarboxylate ABC transporter n=1 Tax=unclassified Aminobacterium TaxID=2685012 RepID=UPI001BCAAAFA|nr:MULTISPECIES: C4-dicarboxylate ABC transporter [unclassified Aminobacterium]MDD2206033.1 C4-dicarboxylate ABC transporter [Aminobacterium sp.]MDD3425760.1 C4-dicarboxylate ABC transporter [Aminobacterium sp.]MDD3708040.1 C4-dicarboxylate ABC transporter [Aminobacterium sp.]MDD4227810.1 C4-dicarboxylate ABC transporter [Aminobacterium sp.]MDD4550750.1 C4-dicarboxylate ABC transporter [Aminobacterium sp.]